MRINGQVIVQRLGQRVTLLLKTRGEVKKFQIKSDHPRARCTLKQFDILIKAATLCICLRI